MSAAATLDTLHEHGYRMELDGEELVVKGPGPVPDELRREIVADTAAIKALVLLLCPPEWLACLLDRYRSGTTEEVRRTDPATGKVGSYTVRVQLSNIVAAVGAELGLPRAQWPRIRPQVEAVATNSEASEAS